MPSHALGHQVPTKQDGESVGAAPSPHWRGSEGRGKEAVIFLFPTRYSQGLKERMKFKKTQIMNNFLWKNSA